MLFLLNKAIIIITVTMITDQCIYNGHVYTQGQTWDDGCDYSCQCTDAQHGMYTCKDK